MELKEKLKDCMKLLFEKYEHYKMQEVTKE